MGPIHGIWGLPQKDRSIKSPKLTKYTVILFNILPVLFWGGCYSPSQALASAALRPLVCWWMPQQPPADVAWMWNTYGRFPIGKMIGNDLWIIYEWWVFHIYVSKNGGFSPPKMVTSPIRMLLFFGGRMDIFLYRLGKSGDGRAVTVSIGKSSSYGDFSSHRGPRWMPWTTQWFTSWDMGHEGDRPNEGLTMAYYSSTQCQYSWLSYWSFDWGLLCSFRILQIQISVNIHDVSQQTFKTLKYLRWILQKCHRLSLMILMLILIMYI